jgi:WD40 repeat protein
MAVLLLTPACGHSSALEPDPYPPAPPFSQLLPRRLTFNIGDDRTPAWLPDGSAIIYSAEQMDRPDHDRCLSVLPAQGGTISDRYCQLDPIHDDSTDLMEAPAISREGRLLFRRVVSWVGQQKLGLSNLMVGAAADPVRAAPLRALPYTAPSGRLHSSITSPHWIGPDTVVYLAEQLFYEGSTFHPDTFTTGLEITLIDFSSDEPRFETVPGTDYASGVDVSNDGTALFYTLGGDSRVYQRDLASGVVSTLHDFGDSTIARDVQVRGRTLVAVVGRSVLYRFEDAHGFVQRDEGGDLVTVDLGSAQVRRFGTDTVLFRHPALSPDGAWVVAETQPYDTVHHDVVSDFTAQNHRADLWLFGLH